MESTSRGTSSTTDRNGTTPGLDILKKNLQLQQLLLMTTLSALKQHQGGLAAGTLDGDKRKFDQLETRPLSGNIAPLADHGSSGSDSGTEKSPGRLGRKPLTEDEIKKSEMDPKSKRKAQNRAAQRAFRERRVNHVKELEDRIKALEENQDEAKEKVMEENKKLKKIIQQLQLENAILGGTASSFDIPLSKQLYTGNNSSSLADTERPQKLLRSIGDNSTATLLSATTTPHQQLYDSSPELSPFSAAPSHSGTTNGSSPSLSSSHYTTSTDIYNNNDELSSSSLPTDILNTLDATQLLQSFNLDTNSIAPELLNTLTTNILSTIPTKSSTSSPSLSSSSSPESSTATLTLNNTNDATSNEWLESLLIVDDENTDSSSTTSAAPSATTTQNKRQDYSQPTNGDLQSLSQVWDKLTEHPRFDEFDIDFLCDEMERKAVCNDGKPCNNKSHQQKLKETVHRHYPSPSVL